jgi:hypothetical protein
MRVIAALLLAMFFALGVEPAAAQRPANWVLLGEQTVGFRTDRDAIDIGQNEEWFRNRAFRALHFVVERNDIELREITITYLNGHTENLVVRRKIRRGTSLAVDLKGERSFLKQVMMRYKSEFSLRGLAEVKVYGELAGGRPGPGPGLAPAPLPPPVASNWNEIDTQIFDRRTQRIVFSAGRGDGSFGQLAFRAAGEPVRLLRAAVRFVNGETQIIDVSDALAPGALSRPIDIEGYRRRIETVAVDVRTDPRGGAGRLSLLGTPLAGNAAPALAIDPAWVRLGTRTVGAGIERDVIRIGQGEDFFRNRRFRSLHLTTERGDLYVAGARVTYINGFSEDLRADRLLRPGETLAIDLGGERSFLSEVEFVYRARPGGGPAFVTLYGEPARGAPAAREPRLLGRQTVGLFGDRDVISVGRQEGRFRQIQLKVLRNDIELVDLRVVYGNGAVDDIPVRRFIRRGEETPPLDLKGEARAIDHVELTYRSRPNARGEAVVELYGLE